MFLRKLIGSGMAKKYKKSPLKLQHILIDDADIQLFLAHDWRRDGSVKGYVQRGVKGGQVYLHREILKAPQNLYVDHINGNPLDNRRSNLRLATRCQNAANRVKTKSKTSSAHKGVCFNKKLKKWTASISANKTTTHLNCFNCETAAAVAYNKKAKELHGEFAKLNFMGWSK